MLLQSNSVSLLKIGTTLAILHIFSNTPVANDLFIRFIYLFIRIYLKFFYGMLFGHELLLFHRVLVVKSKMSPFSSSVGLRQLNPIPK